MSSEEMGRGGGFAAVVAPTNRPEKIPTRILVVDDDETIAISIKDYFELEGFSALTASSVRDMRTAFMKAEPDAIILDLLLPDGTGWDALRWLRARSTVPIIILTAKSATIDKIVGLELGADDYLAKPFEPRELLARLHCVLRRIEGRKPETEPASEGRITFAEWTLDLASQQLKHENGQRAHLTRAEYCMLSLLARSPSRVITRDQLMSCLGGRDWEPLDRTIDVRISKLRSKIDLDPLLPSLIRTVRGAGYMFVPDRG